MIKILKYSDIDNSDIFIRCEQKNNVEETVSQIIADVKSNGDKALFNYCEKFDKAKLTTLQVSEKEINDAAIKTLESMGVKNNSTNNQPNNKKGKVF
jgi:histidinol dehydrogenase